MTGILWPYRLRLRAAWRTAGSNAVVRHGFLLAREIEGHVGWGDACPLPGAPRRERVRAWDELAAALVTGRAPRSPAARHAWIQAAWDAEARRRRLPLSNLLAGMLGTRVNRNVEMNAAVPRIGLEATVKAAKRVRRAGHACLKLKVVPTGADARRVLRVRRAVGPEVKLRLDLNGAPAPKALSFARDVLDAQVEYLEEPIRSQRPAAWRSFRRRCPVPVAADESAADVTVAKALLKDDAVDAIVVKPMALGGLDRAVEVLRAARKTRVKAVVTDSLESAIGRAGALHLAAALGPEAPACGFAGAQYVLRDVAPFPEIRSGALGVPRAPGLGVWPRGLP